MTVLKEPLLAMLLDLVARQKRFRKERERAVEIHKAERLIELGYTLESIKMETALSYQEIMGCYKTLLKE